MYEDEKWKVHEGPGRYFVNQNVMKYGVEEEVGSNQKLIKGLWITIPLITAIASALAVFMLTGGSVIASIPTLIAGLMIVGYIIRKKVFEEKNMKELMADNAENSLIDLSHFNNILSIDPENAEWSFQSSEDGMLSGYLVSFDYASILDESIQANQNLIDNAMRPFLSELHKNNLNFRLYDIEIKRHLSRGTLESIRKAGLLTEDSWLQLVEMLQNEMLSSLEQNSNDVYRQFYLVLNSDFRNTTNFKSILEGIISSTLATQTSIVRPRILDYAECVEFITNYFGIPVYNPTTISRNIRSMDISKIFNIINVFDNDGTTYKLSDFDTNDIISTRKTSDSIDLSKIRKSNETDDKKKTSKKRLTKREQLELAKHQKEDRQIRRPGISKQKKEVIDRRSEMNAKRKLQEKQVSERKQEMRKKQKDTIDSKRKEQILGNMTIDELLRQERNRGDQ